MPRRHNIYSYFDPHWAHTSQGHFGYIGGHRGPPTLYLQNLAASPRPAISIRPHRAQKRRPEALPWPVDTTYIAILTHSGLPAESHFHVAVGVTAAINTVFTESCGIPAVSHIHLTAPGTKAAARGSPKRRRHNIYTYFRPDIIEDLSVEPVKRCM